jgi:hypothetical protein
MAQAGFTPLLIYGSGTTGNTPLAANLTNSAAGAELALNYFDGKLFYKDAGGNVQVLATKATGTIGGSNTQVQYNSSGALAGSANLTFDGTTLTAAGIADSSLIAGRVTYAGVGGNLTDSANFTFDGTTLTVTDFADGSLTSGRVPYASTGGALVDSTNLTFNGTTLTAADITDSSLTAGRVTYAGAGGNLVDSANLTFNGTTLSANALSLTNALPIASGGTAGTATPTAGAVAYGTGTAYAFTLAGSAGQVLTSSGTGAPTWGTLSGVAVTTLSFGTTGLTPNSATSGAITVAGTLATTNGGTGLTSFTANRVFYSSSTSAIGSSANLTFDGTTLTAANFADSSLTSGRIVFAGTGGNLSDSPSLTFDSGTGSITGGVSAGTF